MSERKILASWIMAPDGIMLPSFHVHDYRTHVTVDKWERVHPEGKEEPDISEDREAWSKWNSELEMKIIESRESMIDGGGVYLRRGGIFTEMTVYEDDPFEVIRRFVCRGGRGVNGDQPVTWVPLFQMDEEWLKACIEYNNNLGIQGHNKWYAMELDYRMNGLKHRKNE